MKKFLSWIVLAISEVVAWYVFYYFTYFVFKLGIYVHDTNNTIFWIIIALGGTFGLGFLGTIVIMGASEVFSLTERISISAKGTRYKIIGAVSVLLTIGMAIFIFAFGEDIPGYVMAMLIIVFVAYTIYNIILFVSGCLKKTIKEEENLKLDDWNEPYPKPLVIRVESDDKTQEKNSLDYYCKYCGKALGSEKPKVCRYCGGKLVNDEILIEEEKEEPLDDAMNYLMEEDDKDRTSSTSYAEQLREFKALLDEGLISQEDYDAKKKQILGI